ncbi:transposable element Tc3 transposase [Trichonephila clavipes]|nr:transposable element Tc3 transposase [Trichonephila clavipes]
MVFNYGSHSLEPWLSDEEETGAGIHLTKLPFHPYVRTLSLNTLTLLDEAWLYYYDPTIKQQSSEWKHLSSPTIKKAKTMKSAGHSSIGHSSGGPWFPPDEDASGVSDCQVIYSQFGLAIHQNDHQGKRRFVEWAQNEIAVVPDFHKRILFSDEAHFWLNGYVNKQNCRIWSEANSQVYVETPLHPEKLTVWCALGADGIRTSSKTMKATTLQSMVIARATIDLLKDTFGDHLISRFGPVNWPPRSCDLTPLDYFLWGYVKLFVYVDKLQTLYHLEDNIRRVIADIRPQMLEKVIENWTSRLDYIQASRGSHMPEIIFKMQ